MTHAIRPVDFDNLKTMTYEVTDRVARITFNRPEKGNAIIADTPLELSALVERADLDPSVHVILVSGRGEGFCAGFDLSAYAEGSSSAGGGSPYKDTVLSGSSAASPAFCTPTSRPSSRSTGTAWPAERISRCMPTR